MIEKKITVDLEGEKKPFKHFFRATGYANTDYTYTPAVRRLYDHLSSYAGHPEFMRLHNILTCHGQGDYFKFHCYSDYGNPAPGQPSEDVVVRREADGSLSYDWTVVDEVYDIILSHEMHPIVEMCFIPTVIRNSHFECMPSSYPEYHEVLKAFVEHWTEKYGKDEVKKWYFEVTNEPDNNEVFVNRTEYFLAMYDYFEDAIHSVCQEYKAGGPAVKQWEWGKKIFSRFLEHCDDGINYVSGEYGTRVDFISVHCKAGIPDMVGPQMAYMFDSIREYVSEIKKHPSFAHIPFFNDESDIVWDGNRGVKYKSWLNFRNTEYAPVFMCKMINTYADVVEDELGMNLAIVDSDNCHLTWETELFSGNRSQMTPLGPAPCTDIIKKGFFNAGCMLGKLGNSRIVLHSDDNEFGDKYGVLATCYDDSYAFLIWNAEDGLASDMNERRISLTLKNMDTDYYKIIYRIDQTHSNAYHTWCNLGRPLCLTKENIRELRETDSLYVEPNSEILHRENSVLTFDMPMHSSVLVVLTKTERKEEKLSFLKHEIEESVLGHGQLFLSWQYSRRKDFIGYNIIRDGVRLNKNILTAATYVDSEIEKEKAYSYAVEALYVKEKKIMDELVVRI